MPIPHHLKTIRFATNTLTGDAIVAACKTAVHGSGRVEIVAAGQVRPVYDVTLTSHRYREGRMHGALRFPGAIPSPPPVLLRVTRSEQSTLETKS